MISLSVDAMDGKTGCYGLTAEDLQDGIEVSGNAISGTLKYIEGFTGFSGDPAEQSGNFLALSLTSDDAEKIETKIINGDHDIYADCTDDRFCVYRIKDPSNQKIEVKLTKSEHTESRIYNLNGLILKKPTVGQAAFKADKNDYGKYWKSADFSDDLKIAWTGTKAVVTGNLKWALSNGKNGNYYAFALADEYLGKNITVDNAGKLKTAKDTDWVCTIGANTKSAGLKVKYGNTLIADFDFSGVTLAES